MGTLSLKKDLQEAIANGVLDFWADYKSLIFDENNEQMLESLYFFKEINIEVENNRLLYHMKINPNIMKSFTREELERIKFVNIINQKLNVPDNLFSEQLTELLINDEYEEDNEEKPPVSKQQMRTIKNIQKILKSKFNINAEIKYSDVFLSLECNQQSFYFNEDMLFLLGDIFNQVDILAIVPHFNDKGEVDNARLFIALDLTD